MNIDEDWIMRERLSVQKSISFTENMAEKIREESQRLNVSFADIVQECVEVELPKLKDRFRSKLRSENIRHKVFQGRIRLKSSPENLLNIS